MEKYVFGIQSVYGLWLSHDNDWRSIDIDNIGLWGGLGKLPAAIQLDSKTARLKKESTGYLYVFADDVIAAYVYCFLPKPVMLKSRR